MSAAGEVFEMAQEFRRRLRALTYRDLDEVRLAIQKEAGLSKEPAYREPLDSLELAVLAEMERRTYQGDLR